MCRSIGRLVVRYAYMESYMQGIVYMLADVDGRVGRLIVREARSTDRLDLILDLVALKELKVPEIDFKQLREAIEDAEDIRNLCAHGVWTFSDEHRAWAVQVARGKWGNVPKYDRARRNKRVYPQGQIVRQPHLDTYNKGLEAIIAKLRQLQSELETQLARPSI